MVQIMPQKPQKMQVSWASESFLRTCLGQWQRLSDFCGTLIPFVPSPLRMRDNPKRGVQQFVPGGDS